VAGSVALSGTVTDDSEDDIRTGGSSILLTLTDDTWVAAGAAFDAERQNIIDGLVSAAAEANGWNNVVQAGLAVTDAVRTSNTVVTITLPAFAGYDITATETITVTVPASALVQSGAPLVAAPTFDVTALSGLAGHWNFDEASGQTAADASASANDATLGSTGGVDPNDPSWACVMGGSALWFDGTNDYLGIADPGGSWEFSSGGLDAGTSDFTLSAWVLLDPSITEGFPSIVRKGGGSDTNAGYWFAYERATDGFRLNLSDGTNRFIANSNAGTGLADAQWHHVTAVMDREPGTDTGIFYVDGSPAGSEASALIAGNSANGTEAFAIGGNSTNRYWWGNIDDVRVYDRVLSPVEIAALAATPPANCGLALSGTVTDDSEPDIRAGGSTIILTLTGDSWVAAGAPFDAERQNIIDGLTSAGAEAAGWNAVVQAGLAVTDVVRTSNTVVTVTLPAFAGYDIAATETITATVPASALVTSGVPVVAAPTFDVTTVAGSVAVSGTVTDDSETNIRVGGSTIILTLTDDSWLAAGAAFDAERQNIIDGLTSAGAEANGWNNVVQAGLNVTDVVRTSNTVVTITLPAFAGYDITATETITATVPASALVQSGAPLVAAPTFDVTVVAGSVALSGTVTDDSELDIRTGGSTIILTLTDDSWVSAGAAFDAERQNIIDGLTSAGAEANGWNNVVQAGLNLTDVVRTSNPSRCRHLPATTSRPPRRSRRQCRRRRWSNRPSRSLQPRHSTSPWRQEPPR
jgi:hypothetical protein